MPRVYTTRPLADCLWEKVDRADPDACWVFPGAVTGSGHAFIRHQGKNLFAHRVAYELAIGPIPAGLLVCHSCDVPNCINPAHLWTGTPADNMHDRDRKGRHVASPGEKNGMARLTREQAAEIRARYVAGGVTQRTLGREYGVTPSVISDIVIGKSWRDEHMPVHVPQWHGRGAPPGAAHPGAKITAEQVQEIRARYAAGGVKQVDLGRAFGLSQTAVSRIIRGEHWTLE